MARGKVVYFAMIPDGDECGVMDERTRFGFSRDKKSQICVSRKSWDSLSRELVAAGLRLVDVSDDGQSPLQ